MQLRIFIACIFLINAICLSTIPFKNDATAQGIYNAQSSSDVYVRGYTKKDGTYVRPHYRSRPNSSTRDNWSTRGNTNPYTGKRGTKSPTYQNRGTFGIRQPSYRR